VLVSLISRTKVTSWWPESRESFEGDYMYGLWAEVGMGHEHQPVCVGREGAHRHLRCELCGDLLCASSRSTREEIQVREVTGTVVGVRSNLTGSQAVIGEGIQRRTLLITAARCGQATVTTVDATPWQ
jgi:hypothetical protein